VRIINWLKEWYIYLFKDWVYRCVDCDKFVFDSKRVGWGNWRCKKHNNKEH
jgi:hypothetical protein